MTQVSNAGDLETKPYIQFQQKTWAVQRVAWMVLLAILVAALLGLFGGTGPLAQASISDADDTLRIHYNRFSQYLSPIDLHIEVDVPEGAGDTLHFWIDRQYLDGFIVQNITPEPDKIEATPDRLIYEFPLAESNGTIIITLHVRHDQIGVLQGRMGLEDGATLEFTQFVYP
jgi:hypothetical protein